MNLVSSGRSLASAGGSLFAALRPFVARPGDAAGRPGRACELCGAPLDADHPHLADVEHRSLACACRSCALLFTKAGAGARFRTVPDRHLRDPSFALADEEWEALGIPVSLAFFFKTSAGAPSSGAPSSDAPSSDAPSSDAPSLAAARWTAVYPSPAGPVESLLRLEAWGPIASRTSLAGAVEPDVEALLLTENRNGAHGYECMLVPIQACYALVGHFRRRWRGFDGGEEARRAIADHLGALHARCCDVTDGESARSAARSTPGEPA